MSLDDFQPNMFDILELEKKGVIDNNNFNEKFLMLYKRYYSFLEKYINDIININSIDESVELHQSNLATVKKDDMDIYQYLSSFKYFYLRNTLYIEKLNAEELNFLESNNIYNENVFHFIKNTYKKVITTSTSLDGLNINYGPMDSINFYAPSNALIIGFRYDPEFDGELANKDDNLWYDNYQNQQIFISTVLRKFEEHSNEASDITIRIIKYDEFSCKKKVNLEDMKSNVSKL